VTVSSVDDLRALIREVPDFPKPGIRFYDITTLLKQPDAFREVIDRMADQVGDTGVDLVVGMESRGFIFSAPLAYKLGAGFVPVRKLGKLPAETIEVEYELEYGTATLEIHSDAIDKGEIAGLSFMVELSALNGRDKLGEFEIHTLLSY
jgi:adenine phosphoribosyltransferase